MKSYRKLPTAHFISYQDDSASNTVTPVEEVTLKQMGITPFEESLVVEKYHYLPNYEIVKSNFELYCENGIWFYRTC